MRLHSKDLTNVTLICMLIAMWALVFVTAAKCQNLDTVRIVHVEDGDTFKTENNRWLRLAAIDCPETGTMAGNRVAKHLEDKIEGEHMIIHKIGVGYYKRDIVYLYFLDGDILNGVLLRSGLCDFYRYHP